MISPTPVSVSSSAASGLRGEAVIPGDKSISHRALMLSSQVLGKTRITGLLEGEDVLNTAKAMRALGVQVERKNSGEWLVQGVGVGGLHESESVLDMGNSGTSARLLMGLVAPYSFTTFFSGDASLSKRPMERVISPLTEMGARFVAREGARLPLALQGSDSALPITYRLPVPSAQVKSAVMLAALSTPGETTIIEPQATRDHTENMLMHLGFELKRGINENDEIFITLKGQQEIAPADRTLEVPSDPSSAAFLVVGALITPGSQLMLKNICMNALRVGLFDTLKEMGANIEFLNRRVNCGEPVADIRVKSSALKGVTVPASRAPSMIDEYPILAVAAAYASGETVMEGLQELKVKESNRLSAIIDGLGACGVKCSSGENSIRITGMKRPKGGAMIQTNLDHRIAMSFLVMGMNTTEPVSIDDASAINTSFPGFITLCNRLGAQLQDSTCHVLNSPLIIAIDGPAASGKGTLARRLAEQFGLTYLDTGSLYRAVGLKIEYSGNDPHDKKAAMDAARSITPEDLGNKRLRQEHIGNAASVVSAMPEVRDILLDFQRNFADSEAGAVLDGRDIGTVVYPDAPLKLYLTASLEARARRRHRELSGQGIEVVFDSVFKDLEERDKRDSERDIAPLKPADDAVVIDTSTMDANSVYQKAQQMVLDYLRRQSPDRRRQA